MISSAIDALRKKVKERVDPAVRGPVALNRFFLELNLTHKALPKLTRGEVAADLRKDGFTIEAMETPDDPVDGFLFTAGEIGWAFVNASDILPRRRFTAAHELGHFVLHRDRMGRYRADATIRENAEDPDEMESEANRFAAELLMPEEILIARADELRNDYKACPRMVLAYRLASELLVSREAMRYRLKTLGVGDGE